MAFSSKVQKIERKRPLKSEWEKPKKDHSGKPNHRQKHQEKELY